MSSQSRPPHPRRPRSVVLDQEMPAQPFALAIEEGQVQLSEADGGVVAVVFLAMSCIRDHQAGMLEHRLRGTAEQAGGRMAVSFSEVQDITSAGINALLAVHACCRELGGHLAVFGLCRELRRLFRLTHLDRAIIITDDAAGALRSFEAGHRRRWSLRRAGRDAA
jgi:anti-anti-sigma regulatory factor